MFSFIFHLGVQEPPYVPRRKQEEAIAVQEKPKDSAAIERQLAPKMRKVDWFKELPFYQIAVLYMATRLYVNLYQVSQEIIDKIEKKRHVFSGANVRIT